MARTPSPPADPCPYCANGTSLQVSIAARHGRAALLRSMWCANCRGTYMALRRLLPEVTVVDRRRHRAPGRFDVERLRRSLWEPVRKPPVQGLRDPSTLEQIPNYLEGLAPEYLLNFIVEQVTLVAPEPNGEVSTDQIAEVALVALHRMHGLVFLRSAVHHRMMRLAANDQQIDELAAIAQRLVSQVLQEETRPPPAVPAVRELSPPIICPRCGSARVARRSHATTLRGLEQQPASCSNCGQKYIWEWGSNVPLLVTSEDGASLFDLPRFRSGIRSAVRKLPGAAAIWSDEKLIESAAHTAAVSATPYINGPTPEHPFPSIDSEDLWLAAASALKSIHPLAFVRFALHSGALDELDWQDKENARSFTRIEAVVQGICRDYFNSPKFPNLALL